MRCMSIEAISSENVECLQLENSYPSSSDYNPDNGQDIPNTRRSKAALRRMRSESITQPNVRSLLAAAPVLAVHVSAQAPATTHERISVEAIDALIKYVNNPKHYNPLNYAIVVNDFVAAKALIDADIGINAQETDHLTPSLRLQMLSYNSGKNQQEIINLFNRILPKIDLELQMYNNCEITQGQALLNCTIHSSHLHFTETLKNLLDKYKISPNFAFSDQTPLQLAVRGHNMEKVKLLLQYGAKIDTVDCFSQHWWSGTDADINKVADHIKEFKGSISFLVGAGANRFMPSDTNKQRRAIDQLLKNVLSSQNEYGGALFKKEIIPFLIGLGAELHF